MKTEPEDDAQAESLSDSVTHMLEECRMVLPGIQALFGFQLVAVFNSTFWTKLDRLEQVIHYVALGLVACSVALVMTPAAYHRQAEPMTVSKRFLTISTRLLYWSMYPLMSAILLDFYLIGSLILDSRLLSLLVAVAISAVFLVLWVFLPRVRRLQRMLSGFDCRFRRLRQALPRAVCCTGSDRGPAAPSTRRACRIRPRAPCPSPESDRPLEWSSIDAR